MLFQILPVFLVTLQVRSEKDCVWSSSKNFLVWLSWKSNADTWILGLRCICALLPLRCFELKRAKNNKRRHLDANVISLVYLIIIRLPQSSAGHKPTQSLAFSLDSRSSSCQSSCKNRHSTWPEVRVVYTTIPWGIGLGEPRGRIDIYRDAVSTLELVYLRGCRFYGLYYFAYFQEIIDILVINRIRNPAYAN
jgi:hypothetical protein